MNDKKVKIETLSEEEIAKRGVREWPIWEKEPSRFDWSYDAVEECLVIEGEFTVETEEGAYQVKLGDFVTFAKGLSCIWDIKKGVRKHYNFI